RRRGPWPHSRPGRPLARRSVWPSSWCWFASCVPCPSSFQVDPLLVKPLRQALLQCGHCLGQRAGLVILVGGPAVAYRPDDEPEHLLLSDLDVAVPLDVPGDGGEHL